MEKQIPGTPLMAEGDWDSEWAVKAPSLPGLKELLGLPLLVEFCRCSVAADRLVSLGDFALFNDERRPRLQIAHSRNLQAMFWLVCGTLHEAIDALDELELLGIEGLLGSFDARKPWIDLRSTAARWNEDPIYQRVRNKIAFHLDPAAVRAGINKPSRESEPVVWKTGNTKQDRSSIFNFAQDCLLSVVFPEEATDEEAHKRFVAFCERVRDAHLGFSSWTQELFISAVRGATLGLKLTPLKRPTFEGLSLERLSDIGEMVAEMPSGSMKDAVLELLSEVGRLGGLVKRLQNDPGLAEAQLRRDDEERRLRAIAATAKEFLINRAPAAEKRLRELLGMEPAP